MVDAGGRLPVGKLRPELLAELLDRTPSLPPEVLLGPAVGEDACAIEVPAGVIVAATDPITFAGADAARLSVIVNANDVAVTGVRPRWFLATVLLPPGTGEAAVRDLFAGIGAGLAEVGAVLVGGHTEVTGSVIRPVVVGHMLGHAGGGRIITTGGARAGDVLVQIGPVPVEGAAVLANAAGADPARSAAFDAAGIDTAVRAAARRALDDPGVCVVEQALAAAALGATALHDLTEGGLAGGLHELARASGLTVRVDARAVDWFAPGVAVCRALGADPWATLSSGSVLAAFAPDRAAGAVERLTAAGHRRAVIGTLTHPADAGNGHSRVVDLEGRPILEPERDEVARLSAG